MTGAEFSVWRARLGWTQAFVAISLGVNLRTLQRWEKGTLPLSLPIALACRYLEIASIIKKDAV